VCLPEGRRRGPKNVRQRALFVSPSRFDKLLGQTLDTPDKVECNSCNKNSWDNTKLALDCMPLHRFWIPFLTQVTLPNTEPSFFVRPRAWKLEISTGALQNTITHQLHSESTSTKVYCTKYMMRVKILFQSREIFLFSETSRQALGATQTPTQSVPKAISPGVKRQKMASDHSPPFSD
jgi:hypothetical protein